MHTVWEGRKWERMEELHLETKKKEKERVRDGDDTVETGKVIGTKVWHLLTEWKLSKLVLPLVLSHDFLLSHPVLIISPSSFLFRIVWGELILYCLTPSFLFLLPLPNCRYRLASISLFLSRVTSLCFPPPLSALSSPSFPSHLSLLLSFSPSLSLPLLLFFSVSPHRVLCQVFSPSAVWNEIWIWLSEHLWLA